MSSNFNFLQYESNIIAKIQHYRTPILDTIFVSIGKLFMHKTYLLFLPTLYWFPSHSTHQFKNHRVDIHQLYARGILFLICFGVYFTGFMKDLFAIKRPVPPACQLSENPQTCLEYGFPSTHSLHAIAILLYSVSFYCEFVNVDADSKIIYFMGVCIALLVGFSRIYTGMHSFSDVAGGFMGGFILYHIFWNHGMTAMEEFLFDSGLSGVMYSILLAVMFLVCHPNPKKCPCINDSVAAIGALLGILFGGMLTSKQEIVWSQVGFLGGFQKLFIGTIMLQIWKLLSKYTLSQCVKYFNIFKSNQSVILMH